MNMRISKSKFVAGCQCLKRLYFQVHQPELAAEQDGATEAIMQQGHDVGMLARQLFPGGVEVRSDVGLDKAIRATRELVANRGVPAIFEGVFEDGGVLVRVDVLHRRQDGRWRLVEVKSATAVKEEHFDDVAIQARVLRRSGIDVASVCLAHVNCNYVFNGGVIDVRRFFKVRNLTRSVEKLQHDLTFRLRAFFSILNQPTAPYLPTGSQCKTPVKCEFYDQCNPPLPADHIKFLPRLHASTVEQLERMSIKSVSDIPEDFGLSEIQRRAADCVRTGHPWFDHEGLKVELATLSYPIAYLDFETVNPAIPRFAGTHPYQHITFQWSAHIQQRPGAEPEHHAFLAADEGDPRSDFVTSLCAALDESGSIVVYNQQFEETRLAELAASLPDFAERIKKIQARLWDLLPVIRNHVYHSDFAGSYSLKAVLPALVPSLTYAGMSVGNGRDAGLAWESLVHGATEGTERERIRRALLDYCSQDTLALVKLVQRLRIADH